MHDFLELIFFHILKKAELYALLFAVLYFIFRPVGIRLISQWLQLKSKALSKIFDQQQEHYIRVFDRPLDVDHQQILS